MISNLERHIAERWASGTMSAGLHEQLQLQLEMLKDRSVPDLEIVTFPINMHPDGK